MAAPRTSTSRMPCASPETVSAPPFASRYTAPSAMPSAMPATPSTTNGRIGLRYTATRISRISPAVTASSTPLIALNTSIRSARTAAGPPTRPSRSGTSTRRPRSQSTSGRILFGSDPMKLMITWAALPSGETVGPIGGLASRELRFSSMDSANRVMFTVSCSEIPSGRVNTRIAGVASSPVNALDRVATSVDSVDRGRNTLLSFFWMLDSFPPAPPSGPATSRKITTTRAGRVQRARSSAVPTVSSRAPVFRSRTVVIGTPAGEARSCRIYGLRRAAGKHRERSTRVAGARLIVDTDYSVVDSKHRL